MHDRKRSLKYVGANNKESDRWFLFYLMMLSYLHIDNFFPSEIEFCKIWLQCQFIVLRNHVCGKSLEVLLCRGHSYRSNTKTDLRWHKQQQSSSHKSRRSKRGKAKYFGGTVLYGAWTTRSRFQSCMSIPSSHSNNYDPAEPWREERWLQTYLSLNISHVFYIRKN